MYCAAILYQIAAAIPRPADDRYFFMYTGNYADLRSDGRALTVKAETVEEALSVSACYADLRSDGRALSTHSKSGEEGRRSPLSLCVCVNQFLEPSLPYLS